MRRTHWLGCGIAVILLVGSGTRLSQQNLLEGSWRIASVERGGETDPVQIGARLTFVGKAVRFLPNAPQIADGTR